MNKKYHISQVDQKKLCDLYVNLSNYHFFTNCLQGKTSLKSKDKKDIAYKHHQTLTNDIEFLKNFILNIE